MSTGDRPHHRDRKSIVSDRDRHKASDRIIQTPDPIGYNSDGWFEDKPQHLATGTRRSSLLIPDAPRRSIASSRSFYPIKV